MNLEPSSDRWPVRDDASAWLMAIVDSSQDAILSKTLDGIITSWNASAERLFGYSADEAIGHSIALIIPEDRLHEEDEIIARLRAGERVERLETVRRAKDGSPVHIEVSISPVRDANGTIIGASKIVHDISERLRFLEKQDLVVHEMQHRIKNLLSVVQALIYLGRRDARDVEGYADDLTSRITALAKAQSLVLNEGRDEAEGTTLGSVLRILMLPYDGERIELDESEAPVGVRAVTSLALLVHELATNAAKYGGLSTPDGHVELRITEKENSIVLRWSERGGSPPDDSQSGFGSGLIGAALQGLGGTMKRNWEHGTFTIVLELDRDVLAK